jgi:hypothetical protein
MSDRHNKERQAIQTLRQAVARYAEDLRGSIDLAHREMATVEQKVERTVEERRARLTRAEEDVRRYEQMLGRAHPAERTELESLYASARRAALEERKAVEQVRRAASKIRAAHTELRQSMRPIETKVGEHSSVAASALADLDARIGDYAHGPSFARSAVITLGVGANVLSSGQGLAQTAADVLKASGVNSSLVDAARHDSLTGLATDSNSEILGLYADKRLEGEKKAAEGGT